MTHKWSSRILTRMLGRQKWGILSLWEFWGRMNKVERVRAVEGVLNRGRSPKRLSTSLECGAQSAQRAGGQAIALRAKSTYISALPLIASRFKMRGPRSWKCGWDWVTDCAQELGAIQGIRRKWAELQGGEQRHCFRPDTLWLDLFSCATDSKCNYSFKLLIKISIMCEKNERQSPRTAPDWLLPPLVALGI